MKSTLLMMLMASHAFAASNDTPMRALGKTLQAVQMDSAASRFSAYKRVDHKTGAVFYAEFDAVGAPGNPQPDCGLKTGFGIPEPVFYALFNQPDGAPFTETSWKLLGDNGVDSQYGADNLRIKPGIEFIPVLNHDGTIGSDSPQDDDQCALWDPSWHDDGDDDGGPACIQEGAYIRTEDTYTLFLRPSVNGTGDLEIELDCHQVNDQHRDDFTVGDFLAIPGSILHLIF